MEPLISNWKIVDDEEWIRLDGARVIYDTNYYHVKPWSPLHRGWYIIPPNARNILNDIYETHSYQTKRGFKVRIKFKSAENAMKRVDKLFPLKR